MVSKSANASKKPRAQQCNREEKEVCEIRVTRSQMRKQGTQSTGLIGDTPTETCEAAVRIASHRSTWRQGGTIRVSSRAGSPVNPGLAETSKCSDS